MRLDIFKFTFLFYSVLFEIVVIYVSIFLRQMSCAKKEIQDRSLLNEGGYYKSRATSYTQGYYARHSSMAKYPDGFYSCCSFWSFVK
mgnify:CR=1 FL=1